MNFSLQSGSHSRYAGGGGGWVGILTIQPNDIDEKVLALGTKMSALLRFIVGALNEKFDIFLNEAIKKN